MNTIQINIEDYLTEEDKKELAIEVFKESVKKELFKSREGTIQSDSEVQRVIGNITYHVVMAEVSKYIPEFESLIRKKTLEAISQNSLSFYVFKKKDLWDKEESLAIKYMNQAIESNRELLQNNVKSHIENYDYSKDVADKISAEFDQMADTMYKLSELFHSKTEKQ